MATGGTGFTPTYDANGNMTFDGTRTYGYSSENMLRTAPSGAAVHELFYDPMGRLSQTNFGLTTWLAYDGLDLVVEDQGMGGIAKRYVHGLGVDEPLVWYEGSGTGDRRFPACG